MEHVFVDEIGALHVTGNLVRFDLMVAQPGKENSEMKKSVCVVMPIEGFVKAFNLQEELVRRLTQTGAVVDGRTMPTAQQKIENAAE